MNNMFTEQQQTIYDAFSIKDKDYDIVTLYTRVFGDPGELSVRAMQQRLAPRFRRFNSFLEKIGNERIILGDLKRTYRLSTVKD